MQSGTDIKNQRRRMARIVPNGTAPEADAPMRNKLSRPMMLKTMIGNRMAVRTRFGFH